MIRDYKRTEEFGMTKLPKLEGRVKITLHNCKNGKNEIIEGKNIVTNAVRDILANNVMQKVDITKILPLASNWYGGLLLYGSAHSAPTDADDYFIKDDSVMHLTAHAGDEAPASQEIVNEDLSRGAPTNTVVTENSIKQVWEWGTSQGNGQIASLSLTHKNTGNYGTGNTSSGFLNNSPLIPINLELSTIPQSQPVNTEIVHAKYDDSHSLVFHHGEDGDWYRDHTLYSSSKITCYIRRHALNKVGLFDVDTPDETTQRSFTVNTSVTFYADPAYYFDETNKRLWLFSNMTGNSAYSNTNINYSVIDCVNETEYAHGTIISDSPVIAPLCWDASSSFTQNPNIVFDGVYFYFPTSSGRNGNVMNITGFKKINFSNQSDQAIVGTFNNSLSYHSPVMLAGGLLILAGGRVVNGGIGYDCASVKNNDNYFPMAYLSQPYNAVSYMVPQPSRNGASPSRSASRLILANSMLNTSKFNLDSPVTKTTSTSMTVEYTLTEVGGAA